jgi:CheY-specific phosphatase CheX
MAVKFFGQFMIEKGLITSEQLLKAIALQDSTNLQFGELAKQMGFITDTDIERVHDTQRKEDMPFGDLSVNLGIITAEQLKEVLTKQKNSHLFIGEALIRTGAVKAEDLPKHLDAFKTDQAPYIVERVAIPAGVPGHTLVEIAVDLTCKMLSRIANLNFRPGQCIMMQRLEENDIVAEMKMSGAIGASYLLSISRNIRSSIAMAILKEEDVSKESEDMLNDAVMEFVNIVCGNVAAKAAQIGKTIDIAPPKIVDGKGGLPVPDKNAGLLFPIYVAEGKIEVGMFIEH